MVDWGKASVDIRQIRRHSRSPVTLVPVEYARQRAEAIMRAGERRWAGTTNPGRPRVGRGPGLPAIRSMRGGDESRPAARVPGEEGDAGRACRRWGPTVATSDGNAPRLPRHGGFAMAEDA